MPVVPAGDRQHYGAWIDKVPPLYSHLPTPWPPFPSASHRLLTFAPSELLPRLHSLTQTLQVVRTTIWAQVEVLSPFPNLHFSFVIHHSHRAALTDLTPFIVTVNPTRCRHPDPLLTLTLRHMTALFARFLCMFAQRGRWCGVAIGVHRHCRLLVTLVTTPLRGSTATQTPPTPH